MTSIFAILKDGIVENTVVFDESKVDELKVIFPSPTYDGIKITEENAPSGVGVGDALFDGKFRRPQPFASWTFNEDFWRWEAPIAYPQDGTAYVWDEEAQSWVSALN